MTDRRLRVGVIGGGEIAQTTHLPNLSRQRDLFELVAIADPSPTVRETLAARYGSVPYADHRALLDAACLDAVVICSPNAAHAEQVLDALAADVHVLVEKPLCLTVADADRIEAAAALAGRVVQVAYMNRYDDAFVAFEKSVGTAGSLEAIGVRTYDPGLGRFFLPPDAVRGADVPAVVRTQAREALRRQTEEAVAIPGDDAAFVFSEIFLGTLIHDVNLVHALLRAGGEALPARIVDAASWGRHRKSAQAVLELANGARWTTTFMELDEVHDFEMRIEAFWRDAIHTLTLPAPYLPQAPSTYTVQTERDGVARTRGASSFREAFVEELQGFHDAVVTGAPIRTPVSEARLDVAVLNDLFRAAWEAR